jgi:nicotinamidase-related amidase
MSITRFSPDDAALLLIDFQVGTIGWVGSTDQGDLAQRVVALASAVRGLGMPIVLTSSLEEQAQGPILPALVDALPDEFAVRIQRTGEVDAMSNADFAAAVEKTDRRNILIAGLTNDVCTVYPTMALLEQGYHVQVIADAGGSPTAQGDDIAVRRMERAGADITSTIQSLAELAVNWGSDAGQTVLPSMLSLLPK